MIVLILICAEPPPVLRTERLDSIRHPEGQQRVSPSRAAGQEARSSGPGVACGDPPEPAHLIETAFNRGPTSRFDPLEMLNQLPHGEPRAGTRRQERARIVAKSPIEHRVAEKRGAPRVIRVDNGPEFVSRALDL